MKEPNVKVDRLHTRIVVQCRGRGRRCLGLWVTVHDQVPHLFAARAYLAKHASCKNFDYRIVRVRTREEIFPWKR